MASIEERKGKKKTSHKIYFRLYHHPKKNKWYGTKSFKLKADAENLLPLFELISNKSFSNTASLQEVDSWVQSGYLKLEDACIAFPIYGETRKAQNKGTVEVYWDLIEKEFSNLKLKNAGNPDETNDGHKRKMNTFKKLKRWIQSEYPDLNVNRQDIERWLSERRLQGIKASTRKDDLVQLNDIFKSMIRLRMKSVNPIEDLTFDDKKLTVSVPRRPAYIQRVLVSKEIANAILRLPLEDYISTYEKTYKFKPHRLCLVEIKKLKSYPDIMNRTQVIDALDTSRASLTRYISEGLLPKPDKESSVDGALGGRKWSMKKKDLIKSITEIKKKKRAKVNIPTPPHHQTMRGSFPLAFRIALYCGLRNSEVVWLPWDHVDFDNRLLHVKKVVSPFGVIWSPKSKIDQQEEATLERTLSINEQLLEYFYFEKERQESLSIKTFFVFPSGRVKFPVDYGNPLGPNILNKAFKKYLHRAGFPLQDKLTFYSLRHTFCTELLRSPNVNIADVQYRMGHADIRTTQSYLHPRMAESRVEDELLSFASNGDINNLMLDFASDETPQQTR